MKVWFLFAGWQEDGEGTGGMYNFVGSFASEEEAKIAIEKLIPKKHYGWHSIVNISQYL